jgi:hypothetical protein
MGTIGDERRRDEVLRAWERWAAQLLETHISYPQLAYYRSQHNNQSWLASLTTILDSTSLLLALPGAASASQARLTFAMARHALVDITQNFVQRFEPEAGERLIPDGVHLISQNRAKEPPVATEFHTRLAELRLLYEPYAQSLGAYLLFDLPPWAHAQERADNWQRGPWDRLLSTRRSPAHQREEHF